MNTTYLNLKFVGSESILLELTIILPLKLHVLYLCLGYLAHAHVRYLADCFVALRALRADVVLVVGCVHSLALTLQFLVGQLVVRHFYQLLRLVAD